MDLLALIKFISYKQNLNIIMINLDKLNIWWYLRYFILEINFFFNIKHLKEDLYIIIIFEIENFLGKIFKYFFILI